MTPRILSVVLPVTIVLMVEKKELVYRRYSIRVPSDGRLGMFSVGVSGIECVACSCSHQQREARNAKPGACRNVQEMARPHTF
jgi:hypothetical protein